MTFFLLKMQLGIFIQNIRTWYIFYEIVLSKAEMLVILSIFLCKLPELVKSSQRPELQRALL